MMRSILLHPSLLSSYTELRLVQERRELDLPTFSVNPANPLIFLHGFIGHVCGRLSGSK